MNSDDLLISLRIQGEPSALFRNWRAGLRENVPKSASVSLKKRNPRPNGERYFNCESVLPTERKRADLSLSEICQLLRPEEIASFRDLHDVLYEWLSRREPPRLDQPIPSFLVYLTSEGDAESALTGFESLPANEMLGAVEVGPVYLQDRPRVPMVRWLPDIKSNTASEARNSLTNFAQSLEPGQVDVVLRTIARVEALFEKKATFRRQALTDRARLVLDGEANHWLNTGHYREAPIRCVHDDRQYEDAQVALDKIEKAKNKKRDGAIRSWRAT
jgi:hypothetical protein